MEFRQLEQQKYLRKKEDRQLTCPIVPLSLNAVDRLVTKWCQAQTFLLLVFQFVIPTQFSIIHIQYLHGLHWSPFILLSLVLINIIGRPAIKISILYISGIYKVHWGQNTIDYNSWYLNCGTLQ